MEKTCKKCNEKKDLNLFGKDKRLNSGIKSNCKKCETEVSVKWNLNNKERKSEKAKIFYNKNKEKIKKKVKEYNIENKEKIYLYQLKYKSENKEKVLLKVRECTRKYYYNNTEKIKKYSSEYRELNRALINIKANKRAENTTDRYVINNLTTKGFTKEQITSELIEVQRIIIKTKRLCKTLKI